MQRLSVTVDSGLESKGDCMQDDVTKPDQPGFQSNDGAYNDSLSLSSDTVF